MGLKGFYTQTNFTAGEFSPRALGRFDLAKYNNAAKRIENFLLYQLGGASFRPGTRYVASAKSGSARIRLMPFQYNNDQSYILECGDKYMRFFSEGAQVVVDPSDPMDANTIFLSHFDGDNGQKSYTAETNQELSFFGNAQLDTSTKKFGDSSLKINNDGYVTSPYESGLAVGTGDFTFEAYVKFNSISAIQWIMGIGQGFTTLGVDVIYHTDGTWKVGINGSIIISVADTPALGEWMHIAVVRKGTGADEVALYKDGVLLDTGTSDADITGFSEGITLGARPYYGTYQLYGNIDEVRFSDNARWSDEFTPQVYAYGGADAWVTSTSYVVGDYVSNGGDTYLCLIAHTSGTFATDLAAGKWTNQVELEITTPYNLADVFDIHKAQNADTMYLFHGDYPTYKLVRNSAISFTLSQVNFVRGPFMDANITAVTITPSAATGDGITLTASASLFDEKHIGSLWRVNEGVVKITAYTSSTVVTGNVQAEPDGTAGNLGGTSAYTSWAEGAFSAYRGYARTGVFNEGRLVLGGTRSAPQRFFGSVINAYDNHKVNASDDSAAYIFEVSSEEVNIIQWIAGSPDALQIGTEGGTLSVNGGSSSTPITAGSVNVRPDTNYGSSHLQPKRISSNLYHIQSNNYQLRELVYDFITNRQKSNDMTMLADHILRDGSGAVDMACQQSPNDRIWVVRSDGQIAILTRNPEQDVMGWLRIISAEDSSGINGVFESVAIVRKNGTDDVIWVSVKRKINGSYVRYIEYFTGEYFTDPLQPVFLDSSLTLDNFLNISNISSTNTNCKLLLHCNYNGISLTTITDEQGNTITAHGSATIDTSDKKFGNACLSLDGTDSYLSIDGSDSSDDFKVADGVWTIDFWQKLSALPDVGNSYTYMAKWKTGGFSWLIQYKQQSTGAGRLYFYYSTDGSAVTHYCYASIADSDILLDWTHIEINRTEDGIMVFINGVKAYLYGSTGINGYVFDVGDAVFYDNSAVLVNIGSYGDGAGNFINGKMDEIRFTKLVKHTDSFTPETSEYILSTPVITSPSHGLSDGDYIRIDEVVGMTQLNGNVYKVVDSTDNTFSITDTDDVVVDVSTYNEYVSGGVVRKQVTSISGLDHLEGEVVSVQVDGLPDTNTYTVESGAITLKNRASVVHVGLSYSGLIQMLKMSDGSPTSGQTKMRRVYKPIVRLHESYKFKIGQIEDTIKIETPDSEALFTGDHECSIDGWFSREVELVIIKDDPSPLFILSLFIPSEVQED